MFASILSRCIKKVDQSALSQPDLLTPLVEGAACWLWFRHILECLASADTDLLPVTPNICVGRLLRLRRVKHDLGFDLMPRLRLVFGQIAAACSNLAIALRDGKDPSDVRTQLP